MDRSGFTLIELLVVVSIINLFASIVLASTNAVRQRAVTARLQADIHAIELQVTLARNANLKDVTGRSCSDCASSQATAIAQSTASWQTLGFPTAPLDPWGHVYYLDENEGEAYVADNDGPCRYDMIYSGGPNNYWSSNTSVYHVPSGIHGTVIPDKIITLTGSGGQTYYASGLTFYACSAPN